MQVYSNIVVVASTNNSIIYSVHEPILDFLHQRFLVELIWVSLNSKVALNLAEIAQTLKTVIL